MAAITHKEPDAVSEHATADVVIKDQREPPQRMSFLHWCAIVGLGTVLTGWLVPKMWNNQVLMQTQMLETTKESTTAIVKAADSMDDLATAVTKSVEEDREFREDLAPLIRQLDRVADAVEASAQPAGE